MTYQTHYLPTKLLTLDRILDGGIPKGKITLLYGQANTGKSSLALQCAVVSAKQKLKTIIIDSDNTFSPIRLSQMAKDDLEHISPLLYVFKPQSFLEQSLLIEKLEDYLSNDIVLIIVDTISSHYRLELKRIEQIFNVNRDLNRQIAYLAKIAKAHNIAVLLISQVRDVFLNDQQQIEPVAKRILTYWAQTILNLKMTRNTKTRAVIIEKHSKNEKIGIRSFFSIRKIGLIDLHT